MHNIDKTIQIKNPELPGTIYLVQKKKGIPFNY